METSTRTVSVDGIGDVNVAVSERGEGHPVLVLHGGGGPQTVTGWADQLAVAAPARVLTATHPGFAGTPRPGQLNTIPGLAAVYIALLDELDLADVTVVGNSIGGWIAAEIALRHPARVSSYILVDAVGIQVADHPLADFFNLTPGEVAQRSYHDPATFGIDPATLSPQAQALMAGNRAALATYGGTAMTDPTLARRLQAVSTPTLVLWGDSDRIADPGFGRAYAAAIPGAAFQLLPATGHMPQIETPQALSRAVWDFASAHIRSQN